MCIHSVTCSTPEGMVWAVDMVVVMGSGGDSGGDNGGGDNGGDNNGGGGEMGDTVTVVM